MDIKAVVGERYAEGARARQEALCCPVDYDKTLLALLPQEIIDKDYGCGDPSRYVQSGDTVLDLGSGGGKICYMAAQLVGPGGRVLGVDMTDDMLALARRYQPAMAEALGEDRVRFYKGHIQDLALDLEALEAYLGSHPVTSVTDWEQLQAWQASQRREHPMIADASVDLVMSNCVLNLVDTADRERMIAEIFRVLKPGGRVAISDIVADEPVPDAVRADPELWSGCIAGAFEEKAFLEAFARAGFTAVAYDRYETAPWRVVAGIEFRSVTLTAMKPMAGEEQDCGQAVMYAGPFARVIDDAGQVFPRGVRTAVGSRTYDTLMSGPLAPHFIGLSPAVSPEDPPPFQACCAGERRGLKLADGTEGSDAGGCCG